VRNRGKSGESRIPNNIFGFAFNIAFLRLHLQKCGAIAFLCGGFQCCSLGIIYNVKILWRISANKPRGDLMLDQWQALHKMGNAETQS
jgi:hypothetical protein